MMNANIASRNLALPSKRELDVLESLVFLFDAYVYNPFVQLYTFDHFDKQTFSMINDMYDNLMRWLQNYKEWCKGMTDIQEQYMRPLVDRLSKSESAKAELADFRLRLSKAKAVLNKPIVRDVDYKEDPVVHQLHLSAKRPGLDILLKRSKTRYKREHTL